MGAHGAALFADGAHLMTQCNTGGLATGGYGTALGVVLALPSAAAIRTSGCPRRGRCCRARA